MSSQRWMVALIVSLLFGACLGAEGEKDELEGASPAVATADTGGLQGLIVDQEGAPVQGASIGIRQVGGTFENRTNSAANGEFTFSGVPPGNYALLVQSVLFEPSATRISILVDEITPVRIVLNRIAAPAERIVETFVKKGFITCSVGWTITTGTFYSNPCQDALGEDATIPVPLNTALNFSEIVLELDWQPGSPSSGTSLRMILCNAKDATTNYYGPCVAATGANPYYEDVAGGPPLSMRRTDLPVKEIQTYEVAVGDGGPGPDPPRPPVTFQQAFDLYITICYNQNCTEDYTAMPPS